jgi:FAD binding domain/Berberine and berberine like
MTHAVLAGQFARFRDRLHGELIEPGDAGYDSARTVFNARIDRRPRAIARCRDVADVIAAVDFARTHELVVSVRGGGHGVAGFAVNDGGLVIDLSAMRGVRVDPATRTARVEGGATWGDLDHACDAFGLATPGATGSTVGIGGFTLGGGIGFLTRRHGLSCDNLLSADVVTADGRFLVVDETRHPDLFWALLGGGGNFGVVTSFEFRLHPVGTVFGGPLYYHVAAAREILERYRDVMAGAPDELGSFFWFCRLTAVPFVPAKWHDQPACMIAVCYVGDHDTGRDLVRPLLTADSLLGHGLGPHAYPALQRGFDRSLPSRWHRYWRGEVIRDLSAEVLDIHAAYGPRAPAASTVHVSCLDGAASRPAAGDTAFGFRDGGYPTLIAAVYQDPREAPAHDGWVEEYWSALRPYSVGGAYVNFLMDEGPDRVAAAYPGNHSRLAAVKAGYDPGNLFRMNQNVPPISNPVPARRRTSE